MSLITTLILKNSFEHRITLTNSITTIVVGGYRENVQFTKNIIHATFGECCDRITILPKAITHVLTNSNVQMGFLTKNIVHLEMSDCTGQMTGATKKIKHLYIRRTFCITTVIFQLPKHLTHLKFSFVPINCLTPHIKHLHVTNQVLPIVLEQSITPLSITDVSCSSYTLENLPNNVIRVCTRRNKIKTHMNNLPNCVRGIGSM